MLGGANLSRKSAAWNTSKISEHHAIIPTTRVPPEGALSDAERKIYELICTRYALQFLPPCEYEETIVEFEANGEIFRATGRTVVNLGWQGWDKQDTRGKEAGEDSDEDGEASGAEFLPAVRQSETGTIQPNVAEKTTKPPKSYTYHSLLAAMNGIHSFVKDPGIKQKLKEIEGIGTPATQENIITVLFKRGYLEKKKKQVISTNLGRLLVALLSAGKASVMVYPDMTALWEQEMTAIESGSASLEFFVSEVVDMVRDILSYKLDIPADIPDVPGMTRQHRCLTENCDGFLRHIRKPAQSPFFSCPVCHTTFNDVDGAPVPKKEWTGEIVEAPCPLRCGRNARRFSGRYGHYWKCLCSPDAAFKDVDGVPVLKEQRTEAKCPMKGCKGKAVRLTSKKDGRPFWKCDKCGNFYDDRDGQPIFRETHEKHEKSGTSGTGSKGVVGM
jgi:DNA topoisomerase-3